MSAELWYRIIQFFVGIIIVLALLFGLMEASRKYDRFKDKPYLTLAFGYFFLIIWGLLHALAFEAPVVAIVSTISKLLGFSALAVGFLTRHQHPHEDDFEPLTVPATAPVAATSMPSDQPAAEVDASPPPAETKAKPKPKKQPKDEDENWTQLLRADNEPDYDSLQEPEEEEAALTNTEAAKPKTDSKAAEGSADTAEAGTALDSDTAPENTKTDAEPQVESDIELPGQQESVTAAAEEKPGPPEAAKQEATGASGGSVDLSYLANRKRRNGISQSKAIPETDNTAGDTPATAGPIPETAALGPEAESAPEPSEPAADSESTAQAATSEGVAIEANTPPETAAADQPAEDSKSAIIDEQADDSQAPEEKSEQASDQLEQETREELMDDLFPIQKHEEAEPLVADNNQQVVTSLPGEQNTASSAPSKPRAAKKDVAAIGLLVGNMASQQPFYFWPEVVSGFIALFTFLILLPHRHERGNSLLSSAFLLIAVATIGGSLFGPIGELPNLEETSGMVQLASMITQVIGFTLLGTANWLKIKGKLTHHFLTVVSMLYLLLLILTIGLARFIVDDEASLNLLLLLMTGILISFLPIIHSFAYNHPMSASQPEAHHE